MEKDNNDLQNNGEHKNSEGKKLQENDANKKIKNLEESLSIIAETYEKLHRKRLDSLYKPRPNWWANMWHRITHAHKNSRHWGAYLLVIIAFIGYLWNSHIDNENTRYAQIEKIVSNKLLWEREFTTSATKARMITNNQIILCPESNLSQRMLKAQRNDALVGLISETFGLASILY